MPKLTEGEFADWAQHPVTRALHAYIARERESEKESWAMQAYQDQTEFGTAVKNAAALGRCEAYAQILGLSFSELEHADSGK